MLVNIKHPDGIISIEQTETRKNRISVKFSSRESYMPRESTWETEYPLQLIEQILSVKGPAWLCDEIMRDEDPRYVLPHFKYGILGYVSKKELDNKRILDFGCGSGASTMVLARLFPNAEIVGIELADELLTIARARASHYGFDRMRFFLSPNECRLPDGLGDFDYIILNAVYEHLLPKERHGLLPQIWQHLKPQGVLFISETPHRYFPFEVHTTGLPIINYLPDKLAMHFARRFSKRVRPNDSWESLLRRGIRGGTIKEIMEILSKTLQKPILLEPERLDIKDRIDLWYKILSSSKWVTSKRLAALLTLAALFIRVFKCITGITLTHSLSLAIKKRTEPAGLLPGKQEENTSMIAQL